MVPVGQHHGLARRRTARRRRPGRDRADATRLPQPTTARGTTARSAVAAGRRPSAYSPTTVLTGRDETIGGPAAARFYGDFRIRGIDVFQIVQPNTGAPMFAGFPERQRRSRTRVAAARRRASPLHCAGRRPTPPAHDYAGVAARPAQADDGDRLRRHGRRPATDPSRSTSPSARRGRERLSGAITKQIAHPAARPRMGDGRSRAGRPPSA